MIYSKLFFIGFKFKIVRNYYLASMIIMIRNYVIDYTVYLIIFFSVKYLDE